MQLEIAVLSRPGGRTVNEDACGFWSGPGVCFCVLSDGAGGHHGGDVASKLVVQEVLGWFREKQKCDGHAVAAALRYANDALVREQISKRDISDMRATTVVLAIDSVWQTAVWAHLGDSRLYCFRQNQIMVQTRDHSLVQSMVDAGMLDTTDARRSPDRNKLLGAMGDKEAFEPCVQGDAFPLQDADKFLLCSDGFWEYVEENEMERALQDSPSAEDWLRLLESYVLARATAGQDNYSAIAVWCNTL